MIQPVADHQDRQTTQDDQQKLYRDRFKSAS
jgi:hypothetical protein